MRPTRREDSRTVVAEGEAAKTLASRINERERREAEPTEETSDGTDLAIPARRYQPSQAAQDNLRRVLDTIPENERAKLKFRFNVKKPNPKGGIYKSPCGEFIAYGEDWQTKIKQTIGQLKGPGDYEGAPFDHSNKQIEGAEPWTFEIGEDQAREWGWTGQSDEEKKVAEDAAQTGRTATATSVPAGRQGALVAAPTQTALPVVIDPVDAVKKEAEVTRAQIELEKAKQDLERTKKTIRTQQEDQAPKKPEPSESDAFSKQILDSERARIKAEEEAKSAKALAEKEAELLRQKAENEKKISELKADAAAAEARVKAEAVEAKTKADAALAELKGSLDRREAEFTRRFDEIKSAMTADRENRDRENRDRDREPKKTDYAEIAAAIGVALAPLATVFSPLTTALQAKLLEPAHKPEKAESPAAMITAMAEVMEKFKPAAPKQIDSMDVVRQTMDLVKASQPAPVTQAAPLDAMDIVRQTMDLVKAAQPTQQKIPPVDPMDIVRQTVDLLKMNQPQPQQQQQPVAQVSPQAYMDQVLNTAERLQQTFGGGGRGNDDDERAAPRDTLDELIQSKEKLGRIGIPVQIGQQEAEKKTMVRDLAEAAKEIIPSIGKAVAESGYFNRPQAQPQPAPAPAPKKETPDPAVVREQQRRKALHQEAAKREMARRRALAQSMGQPQPQPQPAQRPAPAPRPTPAPRPAPQPAPAPSPAATQPPAPQPSRFVPPATTTPYNLPTESVPQFVPRRGGVPTEMPPQRPLQPPAGFPTENLPTQMLTPQQAAYLQRRALAEREAAAQRAAAQRAAAERVAAQKAAAAAVAQPAPQPVQAPAAPEAVPAPEIAVPAPPQPVAAAPSGPPTAKMWGEICDYLLKAIREPEDPDAAALYLMENYQGAVDAIVSKSGGVVELVEAGLVMLAGQVGAYGSIVSELASAIRVEPGKAWATQLLAAFKKAKEGK